uniref:Phospholipid phosphatase-related protein type 3 n=1 Tax=Oreochromis aureus TaxID=47969 RepID=A0AAZ1XT01_OREAU
GQSPERKLKTPMMQKSQKQYQIWYFIFLYLYFLEWTDVFKPVKSGFNCHDRSLSLPYIDPNHEVIPFLMLLSLAFAGPAITIMIGEAILFCCLSRRKLGGGAEANINAAGCNFNSFIRRAVRFVGVHAFGLCATALITDVLQLMTGYPTPYFLTVCKPNYTTLNVSCEQNPYIMEDICSGSDPAAINQGRKSFPSQHATLASFAAVYVSMYFNSTLTDSSKLLKPLLVFSFIMSAIICGLTRIIQYKNHAIDVYLGFLLGGAVAVYLGLYAVGNFQSSEETSSSPPALVHCPPCSLPHISQEAVLNHLQMKASVSGEPTIPISHSEGLLHRGLQQQRPDGSLKRSSADVEVISPHSPHSKDAMMTFSHTLPRVHTPQAMAAYEEAARRHAATLHHASMDSSRSKQLLSQWKSKNNTHKCSLQVPDSFSSSVDSSSGQPSQHPHHHGSMELRSSSEPSAMGLNGARINMQPRPGSSQLVHIPEEGHERGNEGMSTTNSTIQATWQRAAEKTATCRTNENGQNPQPRIMQVIAMSKQQGLLQTHSKSLDESSMGSLGSTSGSISGSTGLNDLNRDSESSDSIREGSIDRKRANHIVTTTATISTPPIITVHTQKTGQSEQRVQPQGLSTIRVTPGDGSTSGSGGGGGSGEGGESASETPSVTSSRESTLQRKVNNIILIPERANSPDNTRNIFYKGTSITPLYKD